jgi:20S proteasome subunit alpha 6
MINADG